MVALSLEAYMEEEKLPEASRELLRIQAQHSVSTYGLDGEHLLNDFEKEDLLALIMGMERLLLDSNTLSQLREAGKPENGNKAFILGQTVMDEADNLKEILFKWNAGNSNHNVFDFGLDGLGASGSLVPELIIDRHDSHYELIFDKALLRKESRPGARRTDREFLERREQRMGGVLDLKRRILNMIGLPGAGPMPPVQHMSFMKFVLEKQLQADASGMARKRSWLVEFARSKAPGCFKNYAGACDAAVLCYTALLLEQHAEDAVGKKTRDEFFDPSRLNVFGDTRLIQNALWLRASILSNDGAVRRMVQYLGVPEITVRGTA